MYIDQFLQGIGSIAKKVRKWLRVGKLQFNFQQGKGFSSHLSSFLLT